MATHLISPNEAADVSPGGETSVLFFGGNSPRLVVANPLIPRLFDEVSEGVRSLPRGGAEIGGLLVGPKDHEGGIIANEIIPIPIEYRFGPSFRLSSPDLTKIEEAIAATHKDLSKTVVGFYRSRTRGGAEFRDSDQEILLAVELAHAGFATDFHFYLVLSPPARAEMPLGLAVRSGMDWSEFRPYTCHQEPAGITSDLGDPEPMQMPVEEAPQANLEPEPMNAAKLELVAAEVAAEMAALNGNGHETAVVEPAAVPEAVNGAGAELAAPAASEPQAVSEVSVEEPAQAQADPEAVNVPVQESVMVETEPLHTESQEPAKADVESPNGEGQSQAKPATETRTKASGTKKAKAPAKSETAKSETVKSETAAKPRAKKATTTAKAKARTTTASAETAVAPSNASPKVKPPVTPAAAAAVVIEPKPVQNTETDPSVENLFKMRTRPNHFEMSKVTSRISRQHIIWAAAVVAMAALATGGYLLLSKKATPALAPAHAAAVTPATKQSLALTAERRGTDLVLSWNRESASITRASYGMLIIKGKDGRRDIALTPDQLRAGSIVYTPTTDQVEVELSVVAGEQVTKDSVIVFLPRKGDKGAIVTSAQTHETAQPAGILQASSAQLNEREGPNGPYSSPPGRKSLKPFAMPSTPAGPETAGLVHLDELSPSLPQRGGQTIAVVSLPNPQLPPAPEVAAVQNKAPASVLAAAVATDQVLPRVSENIKMLLSSARTIEVTVSIDENGKVVKADAASQNLTEAPLVTAAIEAARRWKFRPARLNNRPIASEMVVKFNFAPVK